MVNLVPTAKAIIRRKRDMPSHTPTERSKRRAEVKKTAFRATVKRPAESRKVRPTKQGKRKT